MIYMSCLQGYTSFYVLGGNLLISTVNILDLHLTSMLANARLSFVQFTAHRFFSWKNFIFSI